MELCYESTMGTVLGEYWSALWTAVRRRFLALPGFISGLITLYGFVQHRLDWLPPMSWWAIFPLIALPLAFGIIGGLLRRVVTLEAERRPKMEVFVVDDGVYTCPTVEGIQSSWVQLVVRSISDVDLENCKVRLVSLKKLDGEDSELLVEESFCAWSRKIDGTEEINLSIRSKNRVNLFVRYDSDPQKLIPQTIPKERPLQLLTPSPERYEVGVLVSAKGLAPVAKSFILSWGKEFSDLSLTEKI